MSRKNLDREGRFRCKIISFRVSQEEDELLTRKVALSGGTKQDHIINSILDKDINVYGNPYVFRNLHEELDKFIKMYGNELSKNDNEIARLVLEISNAMKDEKKTNIKTVKEPRQ